MVNGLSMVWMMFQFQRLICLCHIKWLECNRNIIVATQNGGQWQPPAQDRDANGPEAFKFGGFYWNSN